MSEIKTHEIYYVAEDGNWGNARSVLLFTGDDLKMWAAESEDDFMDQYGDNLWSFAQERANGVTLDELIGRVFSVATSWL